MRGENIEELWYGFWLIKAVASLSFLFVVVLLCKRFLRCIPWNRVKRRSAKHSMVHSLGTLRPPRTSMLLSTKLSISAAAKGRGATDERCDRLICPLDVKDREPFSIPPAQRNPIK